MIASTATTPRSLGRRMLRFTLLCAVYLSAVGFWIQIVGAWIAGGAPWGEITIIGPKVRWQLMEHTLPDSEMMGPEVQARGKDGGPPSFKRHDLPQ